MKKIIKIDCFQDLTDLAGGSTAKIASDLGVHQFTVDRWKIAGIPDRYHEKLNTLYGATPIELYKLSQKIKNKKR